MLLLFNTLCNILLLAPFCLSRHWSDVFMLPYNNNNNCHDNVYGAVVMTKVIARVYPVHLMNVD